MTFYIGKHAQDIIDTIKGKDKNRIGLSEHMWLKGFHEIIGGACLNPDKVKETLEGIALDSKPFTRLDSGSFLIANRQLIKQGKLFGVYLPIDDELHLHFYLVRLNSNLFEFLYTSEKCCKILEPYNFPYFELRQSVDLSGYLDDSGAIMYDNRISIFNQNWEAMTKIYKSIRDFVGKTKI
ncbi:hypothetical protein J4225_04390 [Candidatus Pacearchaeota archaeon]|nr:hypothetical protein [Candidatus Pacearchaeota archaeon]